MPLPRLAALLTVVALAGCASGPPAPRPWAETASRELNLVLARADVQGRPVTVTRPQSASGALPVIVYLPGLGQGGETGQRWAAAWAQAGYAVLGVQPLAEDEAAWRSSLARTGEFRALGELHYGPSLRAERLAALRRLLAEMQARPQLAGAPLDWQRTALAGYEIGAQTALDLAGDNGPARAVVAISPPPMDAPGRTPALLITSDTDGDALGLVRQPAERRRAFEQRPPGSAWLLSPPGLSHAALSGTLAPDGWHEQDLHRGRESSAPTANPARGPGGGYGPAGGVPRGPRSGSATEAALADLREAMRLSTAFLDAQLRGAALPSSPMLTAR
jgi:dienelactone hydrolase